MGEIDGEEKFLQNFPNFYTKNIMTFFIITTYKNI
jgi:hypothetical protein